jgi:hypothetical protein
MIEADKDTGDLLDKTGKIFYSPTLPLQDGDVGYVPPNAPFVSAREQRLTPLTRKERGEAIAKKRANQELVLDIERLFSSKGFETMYGPLAKISKRFDFNHCAFYW